MHISQGVLLCISEYSGWSPMTSGLIGKSQSIVFPGRLRRLLEQEPKLNDYNKERSRNRHTGFISYKVRKCWT